MLPAECTHHAGKLCVHGNEGVFVHNTPDYCEFFVEILGPDLPRQEGVAVHRVAERCQLPPFETLGRTVFRDGFAPLGSKFGAHRSYHNIIPVPV